MASGRLLIPSWMPALDSDGNPIAGVKAYFYVNLTTTLAPIYSNEALTTPLTNPVEANSSGRFPAIWADGDVLYSVAIEAPYGPAGVPFSYDNLSVSLGADIATAEAAEAAADDANAALADVLAAIEAATEAGGGDAALAGALAGATAGTAAANVVVAGKANTDGGNIPDGPVFRDAIGFETYFVSDIGSDAAAFNAQLAAAGYVIADARAYTVASSVTVPASKKLTIDHGATLTGAGYMSIAAGGRVEFDEAGANGGIEYHGVSFTGNRSPNTGSGRFDNYPSGWMWDVRNDNAQLTDTMAADPFIVGTRFRHIVDAGFTGGRLAQIVSLEIRGSPVAEPGAPERAYHASQISTNVDANLGGTNTGAGSKGSIYGAGIAAYASANATNMFEFSGLELNIFSAAGASARLQSVLTLAPFTSFQAAEVDCFIRVTGGNAGSYLHTGMKAMITVTDCNSANPLATNGWLINSFWAGGGTKTLAGAFDLTGFTFSDAILKTQYASLTETRLTLGGAGGTAYINGNASGEMALASKGANVLLLNGTVGGNQALTLQGQGAGAAPYWITPSGGDFTIRAGGGTLDVDFPTQTTAPAAGAAAALPATPAGYLTIKINGVDRKVPYY